MLSLSKGNRAGVKVTRAASVPWLLMGILARSLRSDTQVEQQTTACGGR